MATCPTPDSATPTAPQVPHCFLDSKNQPPTSFLTPHPCSAVTWAVPWEETCAAYNHRLHLPYRHRHNTLAYTCSNCRRNGAISTSSPVPLWIDLLSGGLLLGAVFMATDYVTSPMTRSGMLLYGLLIGIITASIRRWGIYPEGMSFAILIMNGATPLINRYIVRPAFPHEEEGHSMKSTPLTMALSLTSLMPVGGTALAEYVC